MRAKYITSPSQYWKDSKRKIISRRNNLIKEYKQFGLVGLTLWVLAKTLWIVLLYMLISSLFVFVDIDFISRNLIALTMLSLTAYIFQINTPTVVSKFLMGNFFDNWRGSWLQIWVAILSVLLIGFFAWPGVFAEAFRKAFRKNYEKQ